MTLNVLLKQSIAMYGGHLVKFIESQFIDKPIIHFYG